MTTTTILPAEFVDSATTVDGVLDVGGVKIRVDWAEPVSVYVRRRSNDLSVIEIAMASHDGLAQEELDWQNEQAARYPLGPKEYWRSQMIGKYRYGSDRHTMTDEEFEWYWAEGCDEEEG